MRYINSRFTYLLTYLHQEIYNRANSANVRPIRQASAPCPSTFKTACPYPGYMAPAPQAMQCMLSRAKNYYRQLSL